MRAYVWDVLQPLSFLALPITFVNRLPWARRPTSSLA